MILLDVITQEKKTVTYDYLEGLLGKDKSNIASIKSKGRLLKPLNCLLINDDLNSSQIKKLINREYCINELKTEIWKKSSFTSDEFEVSNLGRVRRIYKTKKCIILKYTKKIKNKKHQEIQVVAVKDKETGKKKEIQVSKLVADAFLLDYKEGMSVYRKDGNPYNNRAENLKAMTKTELGKLTGHMSRSKYIAKLDQITNEPVAIYCSGRKAAKHNNVSGQSLALAATGKKIFATNGREGTVIDVVAGYRWKYIDNIEWYMDKYPDVPLIRD